MKCSAVMTERVDMQPENQAAAKTGALAILADVRAPRRILTLPEGG